MRTSFRIRPGEPSSSPELGLFALTRSAAPSIWRLQARPCWQVCTCPDCKIRVRRPGRGPDLRRHGQINFANLPSTLQRRVTINPHCARLLSPARSARARSTLYKPARCSSGFIRGCRSTFDGGERSLSFRQASHHHLSNWRSWASCRVPICSRAPFPRLAARSLCRAFNDLSVAAQTIVAEDRSAIPDEPNWLSAAMPGGVSQHIRGLLGLSRKSQSWPAGPAIVRRRASATIASMNTQLGRRHSLSRRTCRLSRTAKRNTHHQVLYIHFTTRSTSWNLPPPIPAYRILRIGSTCN